MLVAVEEPRSHEAFPQEVCSDHAVRTNKEVRLLLTALDRNGLSKSEQLSIRYCLHLSTPAVTFFGGHRFSYRRDPLNECARTKPLRLDSFHLMRCCVSK